MKKTSFFLMALLLSIPTFGGTLIYRGTDNEKKFISEIDILSIDRNLITFKIGKATKTISFSKMIKYYDTDINMNLAFDDNTSDYKLTVFNIKIPPNNKGIVQKRGKKRERKVTQFSFEYSIQPTPGKKQSRNIKVPYFYLYVLTAAQSDGSRTMFTYSYPDAAKIKRSKTYNEALMFERVISSDRHIIDPNSRSFTGGLASKNTTVNIDLDGIGNREIIAYYLIAWGKDDIICTHDKIINPHHRISKNWHLWARDMK